MILREDGDAVIAIGQASHAWLSGQLARAWGNARFGALRPREEVCLGAEQHDVGMAQWDLAPELNPETGRPRSFMELALGVHLRLWTAAPQRMLTQSRYAALLISLHGTALYERRDLTALSDDDADAVRGYLAGQRALQARLAADVGADAAELARNQRLVFAWDWLSLALCLRWAPRALDRVPAANGAVTLRLAAAGEHLTLDPWPFAPGELRVRCEGRRLEGRFASEPALHAALEAAPRVDLSFALRPAPA